MGIWEDFDFLSPWGFWVQGVGFQEVGMGILMGMRLRWGIDWGFGEGIFNGVFGCYVLRCNAGKREWAHCFTLSARLGGNGNGIKGDLS